MFTITKTFVAALAAISAVQALPQAGGSTVLVTSSTIRPITSPTNRPTTTPAVIPTTRSVTPAISTSSPAPAPPADQSVLFRDLFTIPTAIGRLRRLLLRNQVLLTGDDLRSQIVFRFAGATAAPNARGGATRSANIETFPILIGLGISTTVGFLNPCGINTPHVHPRATEFLTLVEGSNLQFGYVTENVLIPNNPNPEVAGTLSRYDGTVFPQGSIHYQFNNNCQPATFVASLNSEDPGTSQIAQNFFALNAGVLNATLGFPKTIDGNNFAQFRGIIPPNLAQDVQNCLARCSRT